MLLIIDHRDSFTWNLVHALGMVGAQVQVVDSESVTPASVRALRPAGLVLSPGPGHPSAALRSIAAVRALAGELPILGVCLGHQVICAAWGARVAHAASVFHGRTSSVRHDGSALFAGLPTPFRAARYHSLAVVPESLPAELVATAWAETGELMAVRHATLPLWSVQFHPESFLTEHGGAIVRNFVAHTARFAVALENR
jgi:anthranilate synthase/aminodeoxychorismate synthase-like glutamine amidotransferase